MEFEFTSILRFATLGDEQPEKMDSFSLRDEKRSHLFS